MSLTNVGQRTMRVFSLVKSGEASTLPAFCNDGKYDCGFVYPVYADGVGTDALKNDKSSLPFAFQAWTQSVVFVLQKNESSVWVDKATINDSSYGEFYDIGSFADQPYFAGIVLYWYNILAAFGSGEYRIETTETNDLGEVVTESRTYCLKEWACGVNNSVRLEWYNNYGLGDVTDDTAIIDFTSTNWYNQIRVPKSIFAYPTSEYTREEIQFTNGRFQDVKNVQTETYILKMGPLPAWLHQIIKTYCFQSGEVYITDYSNNNPEVIISKMVKLKSGYAPRWKPTSKCAPVTLELEPVYNRREQWKCLTPNSFST